MGAIQQAGEFHTQRTADGCDTLFNVAYRQTYHSTHGALIESKHVFLDGTGVRQRLLRKRATQVLEIGYGTGLNFWLTVGYSLVSGASLRYVALERDLLSAEVLGQLNHEQWLGAANQPRQAFMAWRAQLSDSLSPGRLDWSFNQLIRLSLIIGDATRAEIPPENYQAIYHDAFSPDTNPELWTLDFFAKLYELLAPGGKLATYSAKGAVRRALQAVGFRVEKQPGPPGKREMLVAVR